jgi:glutathione peroxidase-family protein
MRSKCLIALFLFICFNNRTIQGGNMKQFYDFTVKDIMGLEVKLESYRGSVILVVNVASKCGFTPQYEGLQQLYEKYSDQGLVILGFPSNNFMKQEPGTNADIKQFCTINYGVTFPMFAKISVRGKDIHPLYQFLTSKETNPEFAGRITWNFNKFLLDRSGKCINRFPSKVKPQDSEVIFALEKALSDK